MKNEFEEKEGKKKDGEATWKSDYGIIKSERCRVL